MPVPKGLIFFKTVPGRRMLSKNGKIFQTPTFCVKRLIEIIKNSLNTERSYSTGHFSFVPALIGYQCTRFEICFNLLPPIQGPVEFMSLHMMLSYRCHDYYCQIKLGTSLISLQSI